MNYREFLGKLWAALSSKFFWISFIGIMVALANYFITNNLAPQYTVLIESIIGILTVISNYIAGFQTSTKLAKAKAQLATHNIKFEG
jgi:hypothetical protein